jgi:gluconolactonase
MHHPNWIPLTNHLTPLLLLVVLATARADAAAFDIRQEAEFNKLVPAEAKIEKLATGMGFLEGPAWHPAGYLIFSDIPNNELKKWTPTEGVTSWRKPSGSANGNTIGLRRALLTAEHGNRRISITESNGTTRTLVDSFDGKKFNSPNDVVAKRDGTVWFTDPDYGLGQNPKEQPGNFVYRFDPPTATVTIVATNFDKPNGLAFAPDEKKLYVADSGKPKHIRVFDVKRNGTLANDKVFCTLDKGGPDGIRCDANGRVWSSAGDGIHIFGTDGALIGKILVPETPANLCFGGGDGKTLFITARASLYRIPVLVAGATRPLKLGARPEE